jgi:hypothetical protein
VQFCLHDALTGVFDQSGHSSKQHIKPRWGSTLLARLGVLADCRWFACTVLSFSPTRPAINYSANMNPAPRLTCQQCKSRKIRCDKKAPCSACESAQLSCNVVQRRRLPRGRTGKATRKATLLEDRVSRIEKLLEQQVVTFKSLGVIFINLANLCSIDPRCIRW